MDEIQKITGDVVCRLFFGKNFGKLKIDGVPLSIALANTMWMLSNNKDLLGHYFLGKY